MKNKLMIGAASMLLLTACANDEVLNLQQEGISYSVTAGKQSRALDSYCNNVLPESFKVWAANANNSLYIDGDVIAQNGGNPVQWIDQTATRYWPQTALNFYAEVNGDNEFSFNNGAPVFNNFRVADNVAAQVDLMYAVKKNQQNAQAVQLNFRHALSQVCFKAKNTSKKMQVVVKGVSVGHLNNAGNFAFPNVDSDDNYTNHTDNADNVTLPGQGTWTNLSGNVQYDVYFDGVAVAPSNGDVVNLTCPGDNHINSFAKVLTLMPQAQAAWDPTKPANEYNGAYIMLNVELYNIKGDAYAEGDELLYDGLAVVPVEINWQQGKRYIYTMTFAEGGNGGFKPNPNDPQPVLTTIKYDVQVDDFVPVDGGDQGMDTDGKEPKPETYDYTLTYDYQGKAENGTSTIAGSLNPSVEMTITKGAVEVEGFEFLGWADEANATVAKYQLGDKITLTKDAPAKTIYAVWKALDKNVYTLKLNNNGTVSTLLSEMSYADSYTFNYTVQALTREGFTFLGLSKTAGATEAEYAVGAVVTTTVTKANPEATLYAVWEENKTTFTLSFNKNQRNPLVEVTGMPENLSASVSANSYTFTIPDQTPSHGNLHFAGWSEIERPNADSKFWKPGDTYTVSASNPNVTLYAAWTTSVIGGGGEGSDPDDPWAAPKH